MSGFILCGDGDSGHTLVPNLFLDKYMPEANGEYVKIYLYLLRCLKSDPQELSVTLIADKFENTESDVQRALKYWEKMRLLRLEYDSSRNLTGIRMLDGEDGSSAEAAKANGSQASVRRHPFRDLLHRLPQSSRPDGPAVRSPSPAGGPAASLYLRAVSGQDPEPRRGRQDSRSPRYLRLQRRPH